MSEFANPAGSADGPQAQAYIASILAALGDHDPLEVFRSTPKATCRRSSLKFRQIESRCLKLPVNGRSLR